jgi:hypothetical protein
MLCANFDVGICNSPGQWDDSRQNSSQLGAIWIKISMALGNNLCVKLLTDNGWCELLNGNSSKITLQINY